MDEFMLHEQGVSICNLYRSLEAPFEGSGRILLWRGPAWVSLSCIGMPLLQGLKGLQKEGHVHYHPNPRHQGKLHPQPE